MTEAETRDALIALCEGLKLELGYLSAAQKSLYSLAQALKEEFPAVMERHRSHIVLAQEQPDRRELLEQLDALLETLRMG